MQELQQRILQDGDILPGGVVRVERFLNHRVDTALARHIGQAFADAFRNDQIDCILTVEASGIIFAMTTALAMGDLPVIIAKKGQRRNLGDDVYTADVFSFTHQTTSTIHVGKRCLEKGQRVLLIDDFLANGEALKGLMDICRQAGVPSPSVRVSASKSAFSPAAKRCVDGLEGGFAGSSGKDGERQNPLPRPGVTQQTPPNTRKGHQERLQTQNQGNSPPQHHRLWRGISVHLTPFRFLG